MVMFPSKITTSFYEVFEVSCRMTYIYSTTIKAAFRSVVEFVVLE